MLHTFSSGGMKAQRLLHTTTALGSNLQRRSVDLRLGQPKGWRRARTCLTDPPDGSSEGLGFPHLLGLASNKWIGKDVSSFVSVHGLQ